MSTASFHIANLLDKMTSLDKDFRFMATNDLMSELQKDSIKLDDDSEKKVVKMLLKLLEDKNGEVQNLAVKCLGPLVNKVKDVQVETIVETLCNNMLCEKEQLRDISSIGLKTVINELAPASTLLAANVCKKITGKLINAISRQDDVPVQLEALDILGDLLLRFGHLLVTFHQSIQSALLPQLAKPRLAVRKRAIVALSHLVATSNNGLFSDLIEYLLTELKGKATSSVSRTYIQCLAAIARQSGTRVGEFLERIIPVVLRYNDIEDDELREYCLQALESFVRRCPKFVTPYINDIISTSLKSLLYDPNYNYDNEDEVMVKDGSGSDDADMDEAGEDMNDDKSDYSDDDDMSWKVRRAAAKCLTAIISTRPDLLRYLYENVSPTLISRFKEREENVKADIFGCYIALLKQTRPASSTHDFVERMEDDDDPMTQLYIQVPSIIRCSHKLLKEKSTKTRQGCFMLFASLLQVMPSVFTDTMHLIIPGVHYSLVDKNSSSNMKIDALNFLNNLLTSHPYHVFHNHFEMIVPPVVMAIQDPFYKIASEALLVTQQLVKVIHPLEKNEDKLIDIDYQRYLELIYTATLSRLQASDIDQEVKERAITCMAQIIANMGDKMTRQQLDNVCLPLFLDRLNNEITRLTTVRAFTTIVTSPSCIDLTSILHNCVASMAAFLRKNQRILRLSTLQCLDALVLEYGASISNPNYDELVKELAPLISDVDLHVTQLALNLLTDVLLTNWSVHIETDVLPKVFLLIRSHLLQGPALESVIKLFVALLTPVVNRPQLQFEDLASRLVQPVLQPDPNLPPLHKQAYHSIACCMQRISMACGVHERVINEFLGHVTSPVTSHPIKLLGLLTLAEIGREIDLSNRPEIQPAIIDCFSSTNDEVKSAAAFALGSITCGNLERMLPFVLSEIESQPKRQYLLLHSLKEIIHYQQHNDALKPIVAPVWNMLMRHCECQEEGTRNVVAECLGRLVLVDPTDLLPKLKQRLQLPSPYSRGTAIAAIKYVIMDEPQSVDCVLKASMGDFLAALNDPELSVRRVALVAFNSAAHNKPFLIRDLLPTILSSLYNETKIRRELIREVEMGPFKHTVDDGLDLRKAAFECMYTLLDSCMDRLDVFEFLVHLENGLNDHYDIKMLTYLMLVRLSHLCPSAILQHLERIVEPLKVTCNTKVKANSVKQEFEKQEELKRSAMRAVSALVAIPDADKCPPMIEFLNQIRQNSELASMLDGIQKDVAGPTSETSILMDIC